MLAERDDYMARGVHIGMRNTTKDMKDFVFQVKKNRLAVIDLGQTDERIEVAGKLLAQYDPSDIVVVSRKETGFKPVIAFSELTRSQEIHGRFFPGTLTNPESTEFREPKIIVVTDPVEDRQAIQEAREANIPVIGLANTGNHADYIDLIIPANNLGKKSIAFMYYLLAGVYLRETGQIKEVGDIGASSDDFVSE